MKVSFCVRHRRCDKKMLPSEIQLRGRAKPHRKQLKRKPAKCPFWIVKQVLLKLRTNQITWHENPA